MSRSKIVRFASIAAVGTLGALVPIGAASAAPYPNGGTPPEANPNQQTQVSPNTAARASTLPFTGTDVAELVAIGGASLGVGFVLIRRSRRVSTT
jgi:LPXTG-motif cell wall-anchored protein